MKSRDNTVNGQPGHVIINVYETPWSIIGDQAAVDGIVDGIMKRVTQIALANGTVWQDNTDVLWLGKNTSYDAWDSPGGKSKSPVPGDSSAWFGGDGTFATAADWSGGRVPQAGDTAVIARGTVTMGAAGAHSVNFAFQSVLGQATPAQNPILEFNSAGSYGIGIVKTSVDAEIRLDPSSSGALSNLTMAGIQSAGSQLSILEYQGHAVIVDGDSSLTDGASLSVRGFNGSRPPLSHIENDGTMRVDASSAFLGALSGRGVVRVINDGNVSITSATAGETIALPSGRLNIANSSSSPAPPPFLAAITEFGASSSINLADAHVLAAQDPREEFVKSGPTAGELFIYEGSSKMVDLHISGQAKIYASSGVGNGSVLLTAYDTGNSFPIAAS